MGADLKTSSDTPAKPKVSSPFLACGQRINILWQPCCVCTDEKAKRDECMLFSSSNNAQEECADLVTKYKDCMAGYGFKI
ncbi:hypothetical protein BU26DRAFT_515444 [Trematosphaeria pertusa]|uniref:Uncharacterized protein n=1 Tax=Trematosphaeria pertusa TaxID=390896 RepID=A0A6A6IRA0_9PLEO|nr:uncharacterized protein BU26DRAFT_515444 [Trematosphaeria pertusa]KAF2253064.1 hypothetical protein BU26DRAFT_515444 [Trematosphaeria pertusa]